MQAQIGALDPRAAGRPPTASTTAAAEVLGVNRTDLPRRSTSLDADRAG